MYEFKRTKARDVYLEQLQYLVDWGEHVDVRGRQTTELLNVITEIKEPWHHCILIPSRRWNPWLALSEALWILAGRNDVAALLPYNSRIASFSDDGSHLYGAYGLRISEQLDDLVARLRHDPSDRRAVLSIWQPEDLTVESKDPPCNNMVYFKLRDTKLHMTVINRSNDIHWGLYAVNIPTFGLLQEYIAARLGVDMGTQTHLSNSLHVYTDDPRAVEITDRMLYRESEDLPVYPSHMMAFVPGELQQIQSHAQFARLCTQILDGDNSFRANKVPLFFNFASLFLKAYREHKEFEHASTFPEFSDWITAGKMFTDRVWKSESVSRPAGI